MKRTMICLIILFITINASAQIDYNKIRIQRLSPIVIDTISESILVIRKRHAVLYFRQSDIKDYIKPFNKLGVRIDTRHDNLIKLLNTNSSKIILTDWWFDYTNDDRRKIFGNENYVNEEKKYLSEIHYIGADLIHDGKFMIIDRESNEIVTKRLRMKRIRGLYGTRYVDFQLPDRRRFWNVLTILGE
jgi:hypothetical protein